MFAAELVLVLLAIYLGARLGGIGIGFAGALLHQYAIPAAMVVGLIGLIALSSNSVRPNHRVRA